MPELTRAQRAAGSRINDGVTLRRRYGKADAGRPCSVCRFPLVKPLLAAEPDTRTHPTCDPAYDDALEAYRRTIRSKDTGVNAAAAHGTLPAKAAHDPAPAGEAEPAPVSSPTLFDSPSSPGTITPKQLAKVHASFGDAGISRRELKLEFCTDTVFRPISSTGDLSLNEAKQVIDALGRIVNGPEPAVRGERG